jgi:hypothetical protein
MVIVLPRASSRRGARLGRLPMAGRLAVELPLAATPALGSSPALAVPWADISPGRSPRSPLAGVPHTGVAAPPPCRPLTKEHAPLGCSSCCLLRFVGGGVARARVGGERPVSGHWDAV